jgi:hypothetical protein
LIACPCAFSGSVASARTAADTLRNWAAADPESGLSRPLPLPIQHLRGESLRPALQPASVWPDLIHRPDVIEQLPQPGGNLPISALFIGSFALGRAERGVPAIGLMNLNWRVESTCSTAAVKRPLDAKT